MLTEFQSKVLSKVEEVREQERVEAEARKERAEAIFAGAKEELIKAIDEDALKKGSVSYKKDYEFKEGPDSVDIEYLYNICIKNCVFPVISAPTPKGRTISFRLSLSRLEVIKKMNDAIADEVVEGMTTPAQQEKGVSLNLK